MKRGDFAKAFGKYKNEGGVLSRKDFAKDVWPTMKGEYVEVENDGEAASGREVSQD